MSSSVLDITKVRLCTQMPRPGTQPRQNVFSDKVTPPKADPASTLAAIETITLCMPVDCFWQDGTRLRVRMDGGSSLMRSKVQQYASELCEGNIGFRFVESGDAEIRVSFHQSWRTWSFVGTDCLLVPQNLPTMNFGWFDNDTTDAEFRRVIQHEFGHAVGCAHVFIPSHLGGDAIPFDEQKIYEYYARTEPAWSTAEVDSFVLKRDRQPAHPFLADGSSIMQYAVQEDLLAIHPGYSAPWNDVVSFTDKQSIGKMYPFGSFSSGVHDKGFWSTNEDNNAGEVVPKKHVEFIPVHHGLQVPRIVLGLQALDMSKDTPMNIDLFAGNVDALGFWVNASHGTSKLYMAAATWTELAPSDSDYNCGEFDTLALHPPEQWPRENSQRINFSRGYNAPPHVIVWIKGFTMDKGKNWRLNAYATDIDQWGFTIHIDTWADTILRRGVASWIAYPADKAGVTNGYVGANRESMGGSVDFPAGTFDNGIIPKVVMAASYLDFGYKSNMRFSSNVTGIGHGGMSYEIGTWSDTDFYAVNCTYFAFH